MAQSIVHDIDISSALPAKIKVIGVGGGGSNAVQRMIASGLRGVQFACANTDMQHLNKMDAPVKIQLGEKLTNGLGAGARPSIGLDAAVESKSAIRDALADADMVFVTAGMGGGTGTGAAPIIAQIAKEAGALTVGVVTKPFDFEGTKRMRAAEEGLENLKLHVDCLITVPNDRLMAFAPKKTPFPALLQKADEILFYAVKGISDIIVGEGSLNVDFADIRTTMSESGLALMATGIASGENRAREATNRAIMNPLLEDVSLERAKAVVYNITASEEITGEEIKEIGNIIEDSLPPDANIIFGVMFDESAGDEIRVTVIATGIEPIAPPVKSSGRVTHLNPTQRPAQQPSRGEYQNGQHGGAKRPMTPEERRSAIEDRLGQRPLLGSRRPSENLLPRHNPGQEEWIFSEDDDMEIPTFLRRQAD